MNQGKNIYSKNNLPDDALPAGPTVFISHRRQDKPAARAIADLLQTLDVHVWLDEDDEDLQSAADRGVFGDQALVHAIERGVRHSSDLIGFLSTKTMGSWWVPYEIGYSRASNKTSSFAIAINEGQKLDLPAYISNSSTYWSVDELARWASMLRGGGLHSDLTAVPDEVYNALKPYLPLDPPASDTAQICERAMEAITRLGDPRAQAALELTTQNFDWLPTSGGIIRDIAYDLLAPLALVRFTAPLPPPENDLLQVAYATPTEHYALARCGPQIEYHPENGDWRRQRYRTPRQSWLQGLRRDQLDSRLERFMTARDRKGNLRIATKEEFKAEFDRVLFSGSQSDRRALGVLVNPLLGFSRDTRPIFWRILSVQHYLYSRVVGRDAEDGPFEEDILLLGERFAEDRLVKFRR